MSDIAPAVRKLFAVVATGTITPKGLPFLFGPSMGELYPVPLFMHADKAVVEKRKATLEGRIRAIRFYDGPGMAPSKPFLGVVEVTLPPKKAGKPMSPERKEQMKKAREAAAKLKAEVDRLPPAKARK